MFSHRTSSCRQPRCITCSSKTHNTEDHPANEKPRCVNCKGDHPSDHKACNTRQIRLGLKPIPTAHNKPQGKTGPKGKGCETQPEPATTTAVHLDVGLTNDEISNVMRAGCSAQA